jgi:hypothetical protein
VVVESVHMDVGQLVEVHLGSGFVLGFDYLGTPAGDLVDTDKPHVAVGVVVVAAENSLEEDHLETPDSGIEELVDTPDFGTGEPVGILDFDSLLAVDIRLVGSLTGPSIALLAEDELLGPRHYQSVVAHSDCDDGET